jgi:hypothetical protein
MSDPNVSWCSACKTVYNARLAGRASADSKKNEPTLLVGRIVFMLFGGVTSVVVAYFMGYDPRSGIRDFVDSAGVLRLLICLFAGIAAGGGAVSIYSSKGKR